MTRWIWSSLRLVFQTGMSVPGTPSLTCQSHSSSAMARNGSCLKLTGVTTAVPPYDPSPLPAHPWQVRQWVTYSCLPS